jgi:dTDP-4-dehydrorhamnose reductase
MSRWVVSGAGGMLGHDLCRVLSADQSIELRAFDRKSFDITDPARAEALIAGADIVVNTAAWTDVDGAETAEAEATHVNGTGVAVVAAACARFGARLIQLSTDYVFPGDAKAPIAEQAPTKPVNAYGRGKLAGELAVAEALPQTGFVVRTAWLYGRHGRNFVVTILRLAETRERLSVVDDQLGQPTWTGCLAEQLHRLGRAALAGQAAPGIYHGTASGSASWYDLAVAAFEAAGLDSGRIDPVGSVAFPRPAARPAYSVLGHEGWSRAGIAPQPHWRDQLRQAFATQTFLAVSR